MAAHSIDIVRLEAAPRASISIPPSKSLTCRGLVLGALACDPVELRGALIGDDTIALLQAIAALGVETRLEGNSMHLAGNGPGAPVAHRVDLGLGGAPARFMLALASIASGDIVIDGGARLRQRPMQDAVDLLGALGVVIESEGEGPGLPLRVHGGDWTEHSIEVGATATSQVVSALLLVAPAAGGLDVRFAEAPTSAAYLELTVRALQGAGILVDCDRSDGVLERITVRSGRPRGGVDYIAADASSAAAAACLACAVPGADVLLEGTRLDDGQPDTAALNLLQLAGATLQAQPEGVRITSPDAMRMPELVDGAPMPDAIPSLALLAATRGSGCTRFTGLHTLRVKECDRVAATAEVITRLGGDVQIEGDDLLVSPMGRSEGPVVLPTFDDHRMAMAGAVGGLWRGQVRIDDPDVVSKSWPTFWIDTAPLGGWAVS